MGHSLSKIYIHIIYHTKNSKAIIQNKDKADLYAYMASIIKINDCIPIIINGTEDHVHVLCVLSKNISAAKLIEQIKCNSSRWIKTVDIYYSNFSWQSGYAAFSVSSSLHEKTKTYIENQEIHHRRFSFKEEYLMFLKEYGIDFDDKYLFCD